MRITFVLAITAGLLIGLAISTGAVPQAAQSQESKQSKPVAKPSDATAELAVLEAGVKAFEASFNKGDAAGLAAQFAENAEVVDEDGNIVRGRENIQARFAELFKSYPEAKLTVELGSVRQLGPDMAIEDGFSTTTRGPEESSSRTPYTVVHSKRSGKWLIASVRDFPEETETTAHDQLQPLEWLVGEWVDQSGESRVETSCNWAGDGNYLLQEYVVKLRGGFESRGTQRIGWDPVRKCIRAWAFDHSGGFGESTWTPVDGGWVVKAEGFTPDGKLASVTRILTPRGPDAFDLESIQPLVGQLLLPNSTVRVVRRPPAPNVE